MASLPTDDLDGLLLFDGVCRFCSAWVKLVLLMDREGRIRFTPVQSPLGRELAERHGIDPDDPDTFLFFDGERGLDRSDAMAALFRRMPMPWRLLAGLRLLPRPLRDGLYGLVARNRYRLLGRRETCLVPPPEVRARFLDTRAEIQALPRGASAH